MINTGHLSFSADDIGLLDLARAEPVNPPRKSSAQMFQDFKQEEAAKQERKAQERMKREKEKQEEEEKKRLEKEAQAKGDEEEKKDGESRIGNKLNDVFNMLDDAEVDKTSISYSDDDGISIFHFFFLGGFLFLLFSSFRC